MSYCTTSDIQALFKSLTYSAGPDGVTAAKAQTFIDLNSGSIDSRVGKLYQTPVDPAASPKAAVVLKQICMYLVAADIEPILSQAAKEKDKGRDQGFYARAEAMLCGIESGTVELSDAVRLAAATASNFSSGNVNNGVCPVFHKDKRQW